MLLLMAAILTDDCRVPVCICYIGNLVKISITSTTVQPGWTAINFPLTTRDLKAFVPVDRRCPDVQSISFEFLECQLLVIDACSVTYAIRRFDAEHTEAMHCA